MVRKVFLWPHAFRWIHEDFSGFQEVCCNSEIESKINCGR